MTRGTIAWTALAVAAGTGLAAYAITAGGPARSDCPGQVVCPLSGETVCRDRCPLIDPSRPDCPGKIVCPLTGELVCRDQCPTLAPRTAGAPEDDAAPPCCAGNR